MIYVGIDIAKLNHYAAVLSADGVVLTEPFKFSNNADGFKLLSSELSDYAPESIIIALESTAHYGDNLRLRNRLYHAVLRNNISLHFPLMFIIVCNKNEINTS